LIKGVKEVLKTNPLDSNEMNLNPKFRNRAGGPGLSE
jgi:hypothetical protein